MDLDYVLEIGHLARMGMVGLLIILAGMIRIPKMELNIWNWIGRTLGRSLNSEVMQQVNSFNENITEQVQNLSKKIDTIEKTEELDRVHAARKRILRFNDEILCGQLHSKEHFDEILTDITTYEHYCNNHGDYENNKAVLAIKTIKRCYDKCMEEHSFLTPQRIDKE